MSCTHGFDSIKRGHVALVCCPNAHRTAHRPCRQHWLPQRWVVQGRVQHEAVLLAPMHNLGGVVMGGRG